VVLPIDWNRFSSRAGNTAMPVFSECFAASVGAQEKAVVRTPQPARTADLVAQLVQAPKPARTRIVTNLVLAQVRTTIGLAPDQAIDERQPLQELGLDSLMAVELRNGLVAVSGRALPATIAFDYPTTEAISRHLLSLLVPEEATPVRAVKTLQTVDEEDVAALSDDEAAQLLLRELDGVRGQ
jgi:hypothetical protein